jgi:hypothetical protein
VSAERAGSPALGPLRRVQLVGLPVELWLRAREHAEELQREFALIAHGESDNLPARLVTVISELRTRFQAFTATIDSAIEEAAARGETRIDVAFDVPEAARDAADEAETLLDEADEYCRRGNLLTLATPDDLLAFRRWYLDEFRAQIAGADPTPWDEWEGRSAPPT